MSITLDESIIGLGAGMFKSQFEDFMMGVLLDWKVLDLHRERAYEAIGKAKFYLFPFLKNLFVYSFA